MKKKLRAMPREWESPETIISLNKIILDTISNGLYREIEDVLNELNDDFQEFIDDRYFSFVNSSSVKKPKMVNKILPHLAYRHQITDKVALLVVDGMTYWQYLILDKVLCDIGIETKKDIVYAWLPSITKLSRQAIFRGASPEYTHRQSPQGEKKLWIDFWTSDKRIKKKMQIYNLGYTHGSLKMENNSLYRQAFVDTELDEKMHAMDDNKDLYDITKNWANDIAFDIKEIYENGYQIYITTDHGNILAHPWRSLSQNEKTFLYEKESRGNRHLVYSKEEYLNNFLTDNNNIREELFVHDNWAVWRNGKSFNNKDGITHGGSHFLEVIVPFVTIEKKK